MAYIIPNATDTTSGNKYAVLDQAEPDSIDFEILGNDKTGVISGCAVTVTTAGSNSAVSVAGGVVVLNNVVYTVTEDTFVTIPQPPITTTFGRFDLIVARLTGSAMVLTGLYGTESLANPTHPKSSSRLVSTTGVDVLSYFNPATDVVLASVYRAQGIPAILASHIVDKRRDINTPIAYRAAAYPAATTGDIGDLYLRTSTLLTGESGVHVKRDASTWVQLAITPIDPGVPIGTVITWVSPVAPNGAVWIECNGSPINRDTYSSLYTVLTNSGSTFPYGSGNGSTTFNLPDFRGFYMAGLPSAGGALGTAAGNLDNAIDIGITNIPSHQHSINHGHTGTAQDGGVHTHTPSNGDQDFATRGRTEYPPNGYLALYDTDGNGYGDGVTYAAGAGSGMAISYNTTTSSAPTHTHTVDVPLSSGLVSGFAGQSTPTPINIQPNTMYVKYYIRYA
jgi:microcystin-dependent protein